MNVQPKLEPLCIGPMPSGPAGARPVLRALRVPTGPRRVYTWEEEPWPLELEVEPWHP